MNPTPPDEPQDPQALWARVRAALEQFQPPYPQAIVEEALRHPGELAPHFLHVLDQLADDPSLADGDDYALHNWAVVFLAAWRDTRAYAPLLRLIRLPYETVESLFGDLLFETVERAVATVCDGNVEPLRELAEDTSRPYWVRSPMLDAWVLRVRMGDADAAPLEAALERIGRATAEAERGRPRAMPDEPSMLEAVAMAVLELRCDRLRPWVEEWFAAGLIDPQMIDKPEFDRQWRMAQTNDPRRGYVVDPVAETKWWAGWTEQTPMIPAPIHRAGPKIGRNDPCPCGSGRKYKKCHGAT